MAVLNDLDHKLLEHFRGYVVKKDLVRMVKVGANVPVFVLEYLIANSCSTDDEEKIKVGMENVKKILSEHYVNPEESSLIHSKIREKGRFKIIDKISVKLDSKKDIYWAQLQNSNINNGNIRDGLVKEHEKMLMGGIWAIIDVEYDPDIRIGQNIYPFVVTNIKPIQLSTFDNSKIIQKRNEFSRDEWLNVLLRSCGYEPDAEGMTTRVKMLLLARLLPMVESNFNFVELGPRSTGKSFVFKELTPYAVLISGGQGTVAKLFVHGSTGKVGAVGQWDAICFDEATDKIDQASNFANKIWNAAKFITNSLEPDEKIVEFYNKVYNAEKKEFNGEMLRIEDKWILNKLNKLIKDITKLIEDYDLGIALDKIYNFIWNEFCDWYIEICKTRIYSENSEERVQVDFVLDYVLRNALKLLHPFMPFVTAEIYSKLVHYDDVDIMMSNWPEHKEISQFEQEEETIEKLKDIIVDIRNTRANMNVHPSKKTKLVFVTEDYKKAIEESEEFLKKLGFATDIKIQKDKNGIPENAISILKDGIELYIPFEELVDISEEIKRLETEITKLEAEVARCNKMLSNPGFVNKAPEAKVNEEKEKLAKYEEMLNASKERLAKLKG